MVIYGYIIYTNNGICACNIIMFAIILDTPFHQISGKVEPLPKRLGLEGQDVYGMNGEFWGTITDSIGKNWKLSTGRIVHKKNQNKTWKVLGNLTGHKIYGSDHTLWGTVTGQDGKRLTLSSGRFCKLENQDRTWYVGV